MANKEEGMANKEEGMGQLLLANKGGRDDKQRERDGVVGGGTQGTDT